MGDFSEPGTDVQYWEDASGAKVRTTMSTLPPPPKTPPPPERKGVTVRLSPEQHEELEFVADVWNAIDAALGHRRPRKWEITSVMRQLLANGLDVFWEQTGGGRPKTERERKAFIAAAVKHALSKASSDGE
jgi:hypothetical protein